jgi:hypothetical protein
MAEAGDERKARKAVRCAGHRKIMGGSRGKSQKRGRPENGEKIAGDNRSHCTDGD